MNDETSKSIPKSQISPLVNALDDCKLAQSKNPGAATATFLNAIPSLLNGNRRSCSEELFGG